MTDLDTAPGDTDTDDAPAPRPALSARGIVAIVVIVALVASTIGLLVWSYNDARDAAGAVKGATVVATVDGVQIPRAELDDEVATWAANTDYVKQAAAQGQPITDASGKVLPDFARSRLQTLVADVIVNRIFTERNLVVSPDVIARYNQQVASDPVIEQFPKAFVDELIQRAARNQAVINALTPDPTDADIQAAYDQQYGCPSGRDVAHILVDTLEQANAVEQDLANGADFATLAGTASKDTGSAAQGGKLGCLRNGVYVPEFEAGAQGAQFDVPTKPIRSQFGYHVILVTEATVPPLDSVKSDIVTTLKENSTAGREAITKELAAAEVTVDPSFGRWSITQGVPSVAAPGASAGPGGGGSGAGDIGTKPFVQDERPKQSK